MSRLHALDASRAYYHFIARELGLDPAATKRLEAAEQVNERDVSLTLDDGQVRTLPAHRVRHCDALGPTLGGFKWHVGAGIDSSRAMAAWTTWQCGLFNLPLGGAFGACDVNPKELSRPERQRLARAVADAYLDLFDGLDTIMPDIYTTPQVMAWTADEVAARTTPARVGAAVGKPPAAGGSRGHGDAIARSGVLAVRETARAAELDVDSLSVAIHGFGNLGRAAARLHPELLGGGRVVAVCDSRGGVQSADGLDAEALSTHKLQTGSVVDFADAKVLESDTLLGLDVDVLYLAATPERVSRSDAASIRARIVCELGDAALVPEADDELDPDRTSLLPDMLATGGRILVAHAEIVQNATHDRWPLARIHRRLDEAVAAAVLEVRDREAAFGVRPRAAAWMVGIERVAEACHARGRC